MSKWKGEKINKKISSICGRRGKENGYLKHILDLALW